VNLFIPDYRHAVFNEKVENGEIPLQVDESAKIPILQFQSIIEECRQRYRSGWIKSYREKTSSEFYAIVKEYMEHNGFITIDERHDAILLRPVMGKVIGKYPKDFTLEGDTNE